MLECGTDTEKIRYLGALRLDPIGEVGRLGANVLSDYMRPHDFGPLGMAVLSAWAIEDTPKGQPRPDYHAPMGDFAVADLTTARPGPDAPDDSTDSARLIRHAINVLADSTPTNWRAFMEVIDEISPYVGTNMVGSLLATLDDERILTYDEDLGEGARPALRLACHMAEPADLGRDPVPCRAVDKKVARRARFFSTWLADALIARVGLTSDEIAHESD